MKIIQKTNIGLQPVFNTNVQDNHNYITQGGVINHNCVVDQGYEGQVHINVINSGKSVQHINQNEKLVQFILVKIGSEMPERVEFKDLYQKNSNRGAGGFGSTDHK